MCAIPLSECNTISVAGAKENMISSETYGEWFPRGIQCFFSLLKLQQHVDSRPSCDCLLSHVSGNLVSVPQLLAGDNDHLSFRKAMILRQLYAGGILHNKYRTDCVLHAPLCQQAGRNHECYLLHCHHSVPKSKIRGLNLPSHLPVPLSMTH